MYPPLSIRFIGQLSQVQQQQLKRCKGVVQVKQGAYWCHIRYQIEELRLTSLQLHIPPTLVAHPINRLLMRLYLSLDANSFANAKHQAKCCNKVKKTR